MASGAGTHTHLYQSDFKKPEGWRTCLNNNGLCYEMFLVATYAKQKHLGCKKSARPIRSKMQAGRCDQKL